MRYVENPPPYISEQALIDGFADMTLAYMSSQMPAESAARLKERLG